MTRMALLATAALVVAANLLPANALGFLPACPWRRLSGLLCPLCGATGALLALGRGEWGEAWQRNALVPIGLACLTLFVAGRALLGARAPVVGPRSRRALALGAGAAMAAFAVARNLLR